MTDQETLEACAKLMAHILSKQAKKLNATFIDFKVEEITDKENNLYGNIKVEWIK